MSHQNNPFGPPASLALQHTASRFPDISGDPALSSNQPQPQYHHQHFSQPQQQPAFLSQQQTGFSPYQTQPQQPPQQQPPLFGGGGGAQPQPQAQYQQSQQTGWHQPQQTAFQPQSHFGQQQQGQFGAYGGAIPSQQPNLHSDLDPYGNLGQLGQAGQQQQQQQQQQLQGGQHGQHPRQYVQEHKAGLTNWDAYEWKQLLNRLDALRESWEQHKNLIISTAQSKPGSDPYQVDTLKKQADSQIDSIHASKLQLSEVESGWRHSTDAASKARVREALNAGLVNLPEFPQPLNPTSLGGSFAQGAYEDARKSHIMSGFQPQQTGWQQPQQTGWQGDQQQQQQGMYQQPQQTGWGAQGQQGMQPQQTGWQQQPQQQQFQPQGYGGYGQQGGQGYY